LGFISTFCRSADNPYKKHVVELKPKKIMKEKENLTAERSLEIIRESIESSQRTITKNSAYSLVWWGICVIVFALLIAYLWKNHGGPVWNVLWATMWVIGYLGERFYDKRKEPVPENFFSKTIGQVWATFGIFIGAIGMIFGVISCGLLTLTCYTSGGYLSDNLYINLTSTISLCFGIASTITGFITKNRIVQVCGFIAGLGGFFCALKFPWAEQLYVMAVVALIGLVIPGIVIYVQNKK
jgi:hypothetical protein